MRLSSSFLKDASLAAKMLTATDEIAFDLYLLLLKNFDGNPEGRIDINYKELIQFLGLDEKLSYASAQGCLQDALRRLDEKYHLIYRQKRPPQIKYIILLGYPNKMPYIVPKENYFSIPNEYWQYGWYKTLPSAEKFCYLINLYKAGISHRSFWSDYIVGLSKAFHLSRNTIMRGMQGLRKLNIIEMEYPAYVRENGKFEPRGPTYFHLLGLYSPAVLNKEKNRIAELYGKERFKKAGQYAEIVYKGNDIYVIEDIIKKIDEYGLGEVDSAFKIVAEKASDNSKRSYSYVIGVLQAKTREAGKED